MKKFAFISVTLFTLTGYLFFSCKQRQVVPEKAIAQTLVLQVDSFAAAKDKLLAAVESNKDEKQLQQLFIETRLSFKKFEWAAEYFSPVISRFVNGPPVQEIEMTDGQVFEPAGLQVIETYLFPKYDTSKKQELIRQLKLLQKGCDKYNMYFANIGIFDWQVFDATKEEVFRILSLGIVGFDNPLTLKSSEENSASLESMHKALSYYTADNDTENLLGKIDAADRYLKRNTNFNSFDRAEFITRYGNSISTAISDLGSKLKQHPMRYNRLLNQDAKTMFDVNAFNVNAYAPAMDAFMTDKKVALGRVLFADPVLSGNGKRSCQSCHQPEKAFTDGMIKNTLINGKGFIRRNTPTLINAALQPSQFYDLRANSLEDQARNVISNKDEMHGSIKMAAQKLWQKDTYKKLFSDAFPKAGRKEIDTLEIANAIGSYVRSLTALNSRFDEYMRGNKTAMNADEVNGFNIFMGKGKCGTCHYMPLFNGTFPPRYMKIESEVIGVPQSVFKNVIDTDMGRYDVIKTKAFEHAFKTMTVRNAARTAPYMHNGVFATLEQVMDFYNKGGSTGLGIKIDNQTLPPDKLNLTTKEQNDVIAFIRALDSK
jgi:cytochrome c peroxidase